MSLMISNGIRFTKLWENPNTSEPFAKQSVNVPEISKFDFVYIGFKRSTSVELVQFAMCLNGVSSECIGQTGYNLFMVREFACNKEGGSVTFQDCRSGPSPAPDNTLLIPYLIFGVNI